MTHGRKPRKPRFVAANSIFIALAGASKLAPGDQREMTDRATAAFTGLRTQVGDGEVHWRELADTFNMVEAMSDLGIASDDGSRRILRAAQDAIGELLERYKETKSWTMRGSEIYDVNECLWLYSVQLSFVSARELATAKRNVSNKISAALAGNAGKGVKVYQIGDGC